MVPATVDLLPCRALLELLHCCGTNVLQVVGTRVGDDGVPDDGFVRLVRIRGWPLSRYIDK